MLMLVSDSIHPRSDESRQPLFRPQNAKRDCVFTIDDEDFAS